MEFGEGEDFGIRPWTEPTVFSVCVQVSLRVVVLESALAERLSHEFRQLFNGDLVGRFHGGEVFW